MWAKIFEKVKNRIFISLFSIDPLTKLPIHRHQELIRLGTDYGGWVVPDATLNEDSICYCAGAGEDISFDVAVAERYGSDIVIMDPTPRAGEHFQALKSHVSTGKQMPINHDSSTHYSIEKETLEKLDFHPIGLWEKSKKLKFYQPKDPKHVSHSALNLQRTKDYFEAPVKRLSEVMTELGHRSLDLLKLDVEGAEYHVLRSIVEDQIEIGIICVEFDEVHHPLDTDYATRIKKSLVQLLEKGYRIICVDSPGNYTFISNPPQTLTATS